jgi:hypothetical protein
MSVQEKAARQANLQLERKSLLLTVPEPLLTRSR